MNGVVIVIERMAMMMMRRKWGVERIIVESSKVVYPLFSLCFPFLTTLATQNTYEPHLFVFAIRYVRPNIVKLT